MIPIGDIYDKDVNFLFGSGASVGLLPTLRLGIKRESGLASCSLEDLATQFEKDNDSRYIPLFMHYYASCIRPAEELSIDRAETTAVGRKVVENYRTFLCTILALVQRRKVMDRRCNVFTTNYDGCFALVADEMLQQGDVDFVLNDGTRGFTKRILQARNFGTYLCQTGVFGRHQSSVPQINLIHLHGSVYWGKDAGAIQVKYEVSDKAPLLDADALKQLQPFSDVLTTDGALLENLVDPGFTEPVKDVFLAKYQEIPIVNPTKWKFHETVYEEHYYQMLRLLSYELEKPNPVLITFGFSFADEHILNLVKRSLSNPGLQVFVCCFNQSAKEALGKVFKGHRNVQCLVLDGENLDFTAFNEKVLIEPETITSDGTLDLTAEAVPPFSAGAPPLDGAPRGVGA